MNSPASFFHERAVHACANLQHCIRRPNDNTRIEQANFAPRLGCLYHSFCNHARNNHLRHLAVIRPIADSVDILHRRFRHAPFFDNVPAGQRGLLRLPMRRALRILACRSFWMLADAELAWQSPVTGRMGQLPQVPKKQKKPINASKIGYHARVFWRLLSFLPNWTDRSAKPRCLRRRVYDDANANNETAGVGPVKNSVARKMQES